MNDKIKNFSEVGITTLRRNSLEIIAAGLNAIDTEFAIKNNVQLQGEILAIKEETIALDGINNIFVVGIGKCALSAARALEEILGERLTDGVAIDVRGGELKKIKIFKGDHPYPSLKNVEATNAVMTLISKLKSNDLVIFVISGGGSTLLCQPTNFKYEAEIKLMGYLFKKGADIFEINTIRKHISLARGGQLAKYAYPANIVSLIFSDVPGDNLEFIASGPTVRDTTTIEDAKKILQKYGSDFPLATLVETPKDDKFFAKSKTILIVNNETALEAMREKAEALGYSAKIVTNELQGEAREAAREIENALNEEERNVVLLYGGETTVTVGIDGKGGRNQELALSALSYLKENQFVVALASDGRDNTDFAGAIADALTKTKARKFGLDAKESLAGNNSYDFFSKTGDYILTGDTGSNVSDLIIAIND